MIVETKDKNTFGEKIYDVILDNAVVFHGTYTECLWFENFA